MLLADATRRADSLAHDLYYAHLLRALSLASARDLQPERSPTENPHAPIALEPHESSARGSSGTTEADQGGVEDVGANSDAFRSLLSIPDHSTRQGTYPTDGGIGPGASLAARSPARCPTQQRRRQTTRPSPRSATPSGERRAGQQRATIPTTAGAWFAVLGARVAALPLSGFTGTQ